MSESERFAHMFEKSIENINTWGELSFSHWYVSRC